MFQIWSKKHDLWAVSNRWKSVVNDNFPKIKGIPNYIVKEGSLSKNILKNSLKKNQQICILIGRKVTFKEPVCIQLRLAREPVAPFNRTWRKQPKLKNRVPSIQTILKDSTWEAINDCSTWQLWDHLSDVLQCHQAYHFTGKKTYEGSSLRYGDACRDSYKKFIRKKWLPRGVKNHPIFIHKNDDDLIPFREGIVFKALRKTEADGIIIWCKRQDCCLRDIHREYGWAPAFS